MKRTSLPLILVMSLAACTSTSTSTSTSEPGPVGSVAAASATSIAPSASATTPLPPPLVPTESSPAPVATVDRMAGIGTGPKDVTEVVPGVSIGPLKLGMTRAELSTLGYVARPNGYDSNDVIERIPYVVVLRREKVDAIEATLTQMPRGLRIRGKVASPRSTLAQVAALFADCGPLRNRLGGSSYRCEGKRLLVKSGGGSHQIHVQIFAEPDLDPGEEGFRWNPAP
jgi:hypothetical protein